MSQDSSGAIIALRENFSIFSKGRPQAESNSAAGQMIRAWDGSHVGKLIEWTPHACTRTVEDMGIDHCRGHVLQIMREIGLIEMRVSFDQHLSSFRRPSNC